MADFNYAFIYRILMRNVAVSSHFVLAIRLFNSWESSTFSLFSAFFFQGQRIVARKGNQIWKKKRQLHLDIL